jgi:hypothetical protein
MKTENIQRAIDAIDRVVNVALRWMDGNSLALRIEMMKLFSGTDPERIAHYIARWDGDFARFYLNADEGMRWMFFNYYKIPLEADKYPNATDLKMALINGAPRSEVYPFESSAVHMFYLSTLNHSLERLNDVIPAAFSRIEQHKIDLYGNSLNWSRAWTMLSNDEKAKWVNYIMLNN